MHINIEAMKEAKHENVTEKLEEKSSTSVAGKKEKKICNEIINGCTKAKKPEADEKEKVTINSLIGDFGRWQLNIAAFYFVAYVLTTFNNLGISFHAAKTDYACVSRSPMIADNETMKFWSPPGNETLLSNVDDCDRCELWKFNNSVNFEQTIQSEFKLICGDEWLGSFSQSVYQLSYVASGVAIGHISDRYGRFRALCAAIIAELCGGAMLIASNSITMYTVSRFVLGFGDSGRGMCLYLLILETVGKRYRTDAVLGTSFGWVAGYLSLPLAASLVRNFRLLQLIPTVTMTLMLLAWVPRLPESPRWLLTNGKIDQARRQLLQAFRQNRKHHRSDRSESLSLNDFEKRFETLSVNRGECDEMARLCAKNHDDNGEENAQIQTTKKSSLIEREETDQKLKIDKKSKKESRSDEAKAETIESHRERTTKKKPNNASLLDLLRDRKYRQITLILWSSFYVNGLIYHGFNLNVEILGGDVYRNFAIAGLIEIPSTVLNIIAMRAVGRRTFTAFAIASAAVCYGAIVALDAIFRDGNYLDNAHDHWSVVMCSMLGKMFVFSTYNAIYIHAGEIFATELRHTGVSSCSIAARVGSIVAPFVKEFTAIFGFTATMLTFSLLSFVTACLTLFLPETKDKELLDRI